MTRIIELLHRHPVKVLGFIILLLLVFLVVWTTIIPHRDPRLEALRKQGYPVSLKDLNAWYPAVPPEENAALVYTRAFAMPLFSANTDALLPDFDLLPKRNAPLDSEAQKKLADFLAANEPAVTLLHSVAETNRSRYPLDMTEGFNMLLPHLGKVKRAVQVLGAEALLDYKTGQTEASLASLAAAGRVADSLVAEPLLISQLVRMSSWGIVTRRVEGLVNSTTLSDAQLNSLQRLLGEAERPRTLERAMGGELACGAAFFTDRTTQSKYFSVSGMSPTGPQASTASDFRTALVIGALKTSGLFAKDRSIYLQCMTSNLAASRLSFPERVKQGGQTGSLVNSAGRFAIMSRMLLPALDRAFQADADHVARLRTAQAALAVERFRLAHGNSVPSSLNELVPAFLNCVPLDPYDGNPLRFKRLASGYVIYSLGRDGKDDGGLEPKSKLTSSPHDITFIVER